MKNFGFTLSKSHEINLDKADRTVVEKVRMKEPTLSLCISCGTCSATCTANLHQNTNLRKAILFVNRGMNSEAYNELKYCQFCGKCQLVCPRGVNTRNLIFNLVKILEKEVNHAV